MCAALVGSLHRFGDGEKSMSGEGFCPRGSEATRFEPEGLSLFGPYWVSWHGGPWCVEVTVTQPDQAWHVHSV